MKKIFAVAAVVLGILSFQTSHLEAGVKETATPINSNSWEVIEMATAIKGAVIAGEKGSTVDYYRKCESCGYVSSSKYNTAHLANKFRHSFRCPKCGSKQEIEINAD